MRINEIAAAHFRGVLPAAAARLRAGSPEMLAPRRAADLLARGSALLGIVVVIAAVRLARGGVAPPKVRALPC